MAILQGRTREQIRVAVGYNLMGGEFFVSATTSAPGDATSVIDTARKSGADGDNGKWVVSTSGTNDGEIRRATDDNGSGDLTVDAFGANVPSGMGYELWAERFSPVAVHDFMNQSLIEATGKAFESVEDVTLAADGKELVFAIPTGIEIINRLMRRYSVSSEAIHDCERLFDETTASNFTQALDSKDYKRGQALRLTVAAGASPGDRVTDSFTALDIAGMTHVEFWIKCTIATTAAQLNLHLDNGVVQGDTTDLEVLSVPALTADTWRHARVALANPESDTALVSVGLDYTADIGACTIWLDDIKAVNLNTARFEEVPRRSWKIDKQARELHLSGDILGWIGSVPLKLVGGRQPTLFSADSSTSGIDDGFVIAYATHAALASSSDESDNKRAAFWFAKMEQARKRFPFIVNGRAVE